jgi:hypothetical protein
MELNKITIPKKVMPDKQSNDQLVQFLEEKLESSEKTQESSSKQIDQLKAETTKLKAIIEASKNKYNKAAFLLAEFLESILEGSPNLLMEQKDIVLDIEKLRTTKLEDAPKEEKAAFILILLKQLQPYISDINMALETKENVDTMYSFLNKVNVMKDAPTDSPPYTEQRLNQSFLPSLKSPYRKLSKHKNRKEIKFSS